MTTPGPFHPDGDGPARGDEPDEPLRGRVIVAPPDEITPSPKFSPEQETRAEALRVSRDIVLARGSVFGGSKVDVSIADLCDLAQYIVADVHPMDRYETPAPDDTDEVDDTEEAP